jgi:DNA-binding NarL/FixJ family response regulator
MPKLVEPKPSSASPSPIAFASNKTLAAKPGVAGAARILVVEDDFLVGLEIEAALQRAGFAIVGVAASAEDAIDLGAREVPDLAIVDIRLLGARDGVEAARVLFQQYGIRCIFATAHADQAVRTRAVDASPLGWLQKPYSMPLLIETVRQALAQVRPPPS